MPMYEYLCGKCGRTTEALRRMDDADAPLACEHCGSKQVRRTQSVFAAASVESSAPAPGAGGCGHCCMDGACGLQGR